MLSFRCSRSPTSSHYRKASPAYRTYKRSQPGYRRLYHNSNGTGLWTLPNKSLTELAFPFACFGTEHLLHKRANPVVELGIPATGFSPFHGGIRYTGNQSLPQFILKQLTLITLGRETHPLLCYCYCNRHIRVWFHPFSGR